MRLLDFSRRKFMMATAATVPTTPSGYFGNPNPSGRILSLLVAGGGPTGTTGLWQVYESSPNIGVCNGSNLTFFTSAVPRGLVAVYFNGIRLRLNQDYAVNGNMISLTGWKTPPQPAGEGPVDQIDAEYFSYM